MSPKPHLLILGHTQHGKDTLAELLRTLYGMSFVSSSIAAYEAAVKPALEAIGVFYPDSATAFADRFSYRPEWKAAISVYNTPDKSRLSKAILEANQIYVGMRCKDEYAVAKKLFDLVLWVHRPGAAANAKDLTIEFNPAEMHSVINVGEPIQMAYQVKRLINKAT